jgi:hypothetical protein
MPGPASGGERAGRQLQGAASGGGCTDGPGACGHARIVWSGADQRQAESPRLVLLRRGFFLNLADELGDPARRTPLSSGNELSSRDLEGCKPVTAHCKLASTRIKVAGFGVDVRVMISP